MNTEYRIVKVDKRHLPKLKNAIKEMNLISDAHSLYRKAGGSGTLERLDSIIGGYLAYHQGEIVGWGAYFKDDPEAHIFTHRLHRRRGIGTRLVERFKNDHPYLLFCPWHRRVQGFFNKRGVNYSRVYLPF